MRYSARQIKLLIKSGEGYNLEFKESFSDKMSRDICAFANANGGDETIPLEDAIVQLKEAEEERKDADGKFKKILNEMGLEI